MKYLDDFLEYLLVVKKHSNNTIINYKNDIMGFLEFNSENININKEDITNYLKHLYDENVNYFKMFKNPKKERSLPKLVKEDDIDKMFLVPNTRSWIGQRNLLIIRMLYATGIRVSELVNITLKDINISDRTIKILGKGSKERMVVFGNNTECALDDLDRGRWEVNFHDSEYLFLNKNGDKISIRYIRKIIDDIIFKASIEMHVSPHMLRHTFATGMLNNGADLVSVKDLLGHESLNTTSIYTHVSDDKIREIYNKAHPRAK